MTDRLNEIKKKLQQLDEYGRRGDWRSYLFLLEVIGGEVYAYNGRHSIPLQWGYGCNKDDKRIVIYASFPTWLRRQIEDLEG